MTDSTIDTIDHLLADYSLALLIGATMMAGCSDEEPHPVVAPTITVTETVMQTPTASPEIIWYGKPYSVAYSECAQKLWNSRVDQWNRLTQAQRDGWGDSDAFMKAKGWPLSHEATLLSAATRKACPL